MTTTGGTNPNDPRNPGDIGDGSQPTTPIPELEPPISPAIYRAAIERADEAENHCAEHKATIAELEAQLTACRAAHAAAEQRHQLDLLLIDADAIDLDTTRLLLERTLTDDQADPAEAAEAVDALKRHKPFLFRHAPSTTTTTLGTMPPEPELTLPQEAQRLLDLAEQAAERGDRRAVLRYLQARRKK